MGGGGGTGEVVGVGSNGDGVGNASNLPSRIRPTSLPLSSLTSITSVVVGSGVGAGVGAGVGSGNS